MKGIHIGNRIKTIFFSFCTFFKNLSTPLLQGKKLLEICDVDVELENILRCSKTAVIMEFFKMTTVCADF